MEVLTQKRILITGASGLLGSNLINAWQGQAEMLGLYHQHAIAVANVQFYQVDLLNEGRTREIIDQFKPDVIVHCAALADIDKCEDFYDHADWLNIKATEFLSAIARAQGIKMVFISTDAVYDGVKGDYKETDPVNPVNHYAETKIRAEERVLRDPRALVVRTSFYGFNAVQAKQSLAQLVIRELSQNRRMKGFVDVISSNIFINDLAPLLLLSINADLKGVYNFGCRDALSKYDFAVSIAREFGLDESNIEPVSVDSFPFKARRGKNLSLNVGKLTTALGVEPVSSLESIRHFKRDCPRK